MLVQISKRTGTIKRVPPGETPIIELNIEPHEQILSAKLSLVWNVNSERKTVDWDWVVYVANHLSQNHSEGLLKFFDEDWHPSLQIAAQ